MCRSVGPMRDPLVTGERVTAGRALFRWGGQSDGSVIRRGRFMGPTHGAGLLSRVSSLEPVATGRLVRWPSSRLDVSSCSVDVPSLDLGTSSCSLGTPRFELRTSSHLLRMPGLELGMTSHSLRVSSAKPGVSSRLLGVRSSEPRFPGHHQRDSADVHCARRDA